MDMKQISILTNRRDLRQSPTRGDRDSFGRIAKSNQRRRGSFRVVIQDSRVVAHNTKRAQQRSSVSTKTVAEAIAIRKENSERSPDKGRIRVSCQKPFTTNRERSGLSGSCTKTTEGL